MTNDALEELRFAIDVATRYHQRRRGFYMALDRFVRAVSVLAGSAAVVGIAQNVSADFGAAQWLVLLATFLIAALNAWALVVGFPDRAREHEDIRKRYIDLEIAIEKAELQTPTEDRLAEWKSRYLAIEADETPTFWAIYAQCWNQVIVATRRPKEALRRLPRWKLYAGYVLRMHEHSFPTVSGREA